MSNPYTELETIWYRHFDNIEKTGMEILVFLDRQGIRIRQDDGELRQLNVSKPTSINSAFVIGLRYNKKDGTQTEDQFLVKENCIVEHYYRGKLQDKLSEYKGTHKQQVIYSLINSLQAPITSVNTISMPYKL